MKYYSGEKKKVEKKDDIVAQSGWPTVDEMTHRQELHRKTDRVRQ